MIDRAGANGEKNVRVRVLNVNEAGSLSITPEQPVAGAPAVATLTDPDGVVAITDWRWATSSAGFNGSTESGFVSGASSGSYVGSAGEFLRVTVKYRDGASVEDDPMTPFDKRNDDPTRRRRSPSRPDSTPTRCFRPRHATRCSHLTRRTSLQRARPAGRLAR